MSSGNQWKDADPIILSSDEDELKRPSQFNVLSTTSGPSTSDFQGPKRRSIYPPVSMSHLTAEATPSKLSNKNSRAKETPVSQIDKFQDRRSNNVNLYDEVEVLEKSNSSFKPGEQVVRDEGDYFQDQTARQEAFGKLSRIDVEIRGVQDQIRSLQTLVEDLKRQRKELQRLTEDPSRREGMGVHSALNPTSVGKDYSHGTFKWTGALKQSMKDVFSIHQFRLCQEGVCNANMDGRDLICIMPTGGGKSLTYQLPAIISRGTTVVISPLLSLMADQIMHLTEHNISAVMLTGSTSKAAQRDIFDRLLYGGDETPHKPKGKGKKSATHASDGEEDGREIKLIYVTPEKVAKSKMLSSTFQKMHTAGRLSRFVLDEAHCVSQLGHDYRPDYGKLSIIRTLFPGVPIMAVTATCSRKVLPDLLKILKMKDITPANSANSSGTVFFDAPLYRKNLHYKVLPKPSNAKDALVVMADYIVQNHADESGIVYCLSKKDTEVVAQALMEYSQGAIKAGVYHADVHDNHKQMLHERWRLGEVNVVVATIAFGLGIDKGNVRFVIHHTISKSLDGYYQETGRAGRDGQDSSCVLYYRGQDVGRMSALICGERESQGKLYDMVAFAQDLETCRKILFGRYFSTSASLPSSAWSEREEACGHCDNCTRDPETIIQQIVTEESWKICRVATSVHQAEGRVTVSKLADLVRGLGGGNFASAVQGDAKKRRKAPEMENVGLNLDEICGGKVMMSKDEVEHLITNLLLKGYLAELFKQTAYTVNVYIMPGPQSLRLTRQSTISNDDPSFSSHITCTFPRKSKVTRKSTSRVSLDTLGGSSNGNAPAGGNGSGVGKGKGKGKGKEAVKAKQPSVRDRTRNKHGRNQYGDDDEDEDNGDEYEDLDGFIDDGDDEIEIEIDDDDDEREKEIVVKRQRPKLKSKFGRQILSSSDHDEEEWEQVRNAKSSIWDKSFG
ncbi:atp-dependent dna helicase [Phaffia rhodozyma]|uniref:ATP-dependent DNA helicase n=1 Tax=Phaffia rhodozyma TaxID=264483 RepID=A0A0F7SSV1_PHARH|nr:atp-dependent dna helicase [Phaffia rhodozyma]